MPEPTIVLLPNNPVPSGAHVIDLSNQNLDVGTIISQLLPYILVAAGLGLLIMLIVGGIGLMTSAGDPDKMKTGYGRITHALIGFVIIFASYLIVQLVGLMLGVSILSW